jgi:predicted acyl esterase
MAQDFYINGPLMADLWVSTTALDAGVAVRVDDVDGSGNPFALTNGIQTVSLRKLDPTRSRSLNGEMIQPWHTYTQDSVQSVAPGNLAEIQVEIFPTSAVIAKGHKLRIAVGASDFPHGLPPLPDLVQSLVGLLSIHSDAAHPSKVVLPVVPVSAIH